MVQLGDDDMPVNNQRIEPKLSPLNNQSKDFLGALNSPWVIFMSADRTSSTNVGKSHKIFFTLDKQIAND